MLKINELSSQEKTWRKLKCIVLSEKVNVKGYTLYDSNMTFWKRQNYGDSKVSGRQGLWGRKG